MPCLCNVVSFRSRGSNTYQTQALPSTLKPQLQQQQATKQRDRTLRNQDDLLQMAMVSQQAQCVRLVVDALLDGKFSKMSVVLHMYDALQALIHDAQVCMGLVTSTSCILSILLCPALTLVFGFGFLICHKMVLPWLMTCMSVAVGDGGVF